MLPHIQWHEKQSFEHQRQLLREAEQQRLLTQASLHHAGRGRQLFARVRKCFTISTTYTQQVERKDEFIADCLEEPKWQGTGS